MMSKILNSRLKIVLVILLVVLCLVSVYLGYRVGDIYHRIQDTNQANSPGNDSHQIERENPGANDKDILNVLLIGVDSMGSDGRSDTIMVARYDQTNDEVGIVSIPRDTQVDLPERGKEKINHAYAYGQNEYLIKAVEEFLDIPIHNYVVVNFSGFKNIIDIIDGVSLEVEQDMYYAYEDGTVVIDLDQGYQTLDGDEALQYVRWRGDSDGDIGRIRRQQKLIKKVVDELTKFSSITKLNRIIDEAADNVVMDFNISELTSHLFSYRSIDWGDMDTKVLPGENQYIDGSWYWEVNQDQAREIVHNLLE